MGEDLREVRGDSIADRVFGVLLEVLGDAGKYASLAYGIFNLVKNEPEVDKVVYAGLVYCFASVLSKTGYTLRIGGVSRGDSGSLEDKLEKK